MEVILTEDIQGLGYKYDFVKVKSGYARNYLIPKGYAMLANTSNKKMIEENVRQAAHKAEKVKQDAQAIADAIGAIVIDIPAKLGESGKIFGAVTTLQISDALKDKNIDVDRKKISFKSEVKTAGEFVAIIDLHKEVKHELTFNVVPA